MIYLYEILLGFALTFAIVAWIRGRPKKWLFPSDVFFIQCVLTSGLVPFFNLHAESEFFVKEGFSDATISTVLILLSIMFVTFGVMWLLRPKIFLRDLEEATPKGIDESLQRKSVRKEGHFLKGCTYFIFGLSLLLLVYPPYREFKSQVLEFLTGQIDQDDYQLARRVLYADDNFIVGLVGRLRYAVYPVLFVAASLMVFRSRGFRTSFVVAALAFVAGPASFSKASIVLFIFYFMICICLAAGVRKPFVAKNSLALIGVALLAIMVLLTGIYKLQYANMLRGSDGLYTALTIAYFRVFVATYGGLLQYVSTFPDGDVGVAASIVAPLFGLQSRLLDQEVAIAYLGPTLGKLTTFPTIFIGNAYATFGYVGVLVYSIAVTAIVFVIDYILSKLKNPSVRIIYYSIMLIQVNFFAVLAAPTAIVTYGIFLIQASLMIADRYITPRALKTGRRLRDRRRYLVEREGRS